MKLLVDRRGTGAGKSTSAKHHMTAAGRGDMAVGLTELGKSSLADLRSLGAEAAHDLGLTSRRNTPTGKASICKQVTEVKRRQNAGQDPRQVLCPTCEHADGCPIHAAYLDPAPIRVGAFEKLFQPLPPNAEAARKEAIAQAEADGVPFDDGILIIDEDPTSRLFPERHYKIDVLSGISQYRDDIAEATQRRRDERVRKGQPIPSVPVAAVADWHINNAVALIDTLYRVDEATARRIEAISSQSTAERSEAPERPAHESNGRILAQSLPPVENLDQLHSILTSVRYWRNRKALADDDSNAWLTRALEFITAICEAIRNSSSDGRLLAIRIIDGDITVCRKAEIHRTRKKTKAWLLSATVIPKLLRRHFDEIEYAPIMPLDFDGTPPSEIEMMQPPDRPFSTYTMLKAPSTAKKILDTPRWKDRLVQTIRTLLVKCNAKGGGLLVVCQMKVEKALRKIFADDDGVLPEGLSMGHFNQLDGSNVYEKTSGLLIVGRPLPCLQDLWMKAEQISGTVIDMDTHTGVDKWKWRREKMSVLTPGGETIQETEVGVPYHENEHLNALLFATTFAAVQQANRARANNRRGQHEHCDVWVWGDNMMPFDFDYIVDMDKVPTWYLQMISDVGIAPLKNGYGFTSVMTRLMDYSPHAAEKKKQRQKYDFDVLNRHFWPHPRELSYHMRLRPVGGEGSRGNYADILVLSQSGRKAKDLLLERFPHGDVKGTKSKSREKEKKNGTGDIKLSILDGLPPTGDEAGVLEDQSRGGRAHDGRDPDRSEDRPAPGTEEDTRHTGDQRGAA
ncbi:hypothetical protein SuNHUV7_30980 (plasmid) [Pseudoseohaeicola sp. NH-UV-7]|uniref:hypothetical protein n=1 Tax=Sulfitobacter sp. TBRI5 TaxID=2989732 RepID=UPI003A640527